MTLGQRIQELRKGAGLSQEGLGEALGVSRQAVSKWESDGGVPELDTLIAMSRLFEVTLGWLLGVEEARADPASGEQSRPGVDEAVIEEVLRRYAQEQERQRAMADLAAKTDPQRRKARRNLLVAAGAAAVLVVLLGVRLYDEIQGLRGYIGSLESRLINLNNSVSGSISSITGQIEEILEAQNSLVSGADWTVTAFDLAAGTVSVRHTVTLKSYTPGTQIQLLYRWETPAGESGETATGWAEGPDFVIEGELPMNHHLERTARIRDAEGGIQEQPLDTVYGGMHPEDFQIWSKGLSVPYVIEVGNSMSVGTGSGGAVTLMSTHPELLWPVSARLTAALNGQVVADTALSIVPESRGVWRGEMDAVELKLKEGDEVVFTATVTDNLGRTMELREGYRASDGHFRQEPMAEVNTFG